MIIQPIIIDIQIISKNMQTNKNTKERKMNQKYKKISLLNSLVVPSIVDTCDGIGVVSYIIIDGNNLKKYKNKNKRKIK